MDFETLSFIEPMNPLNTEKLSRVCLILCIVLIISLVLYKISTLVGRMPWIHTLHPSSYFSSAKALRKELYRGSDGSNHDISENCTVSL